MRQKDIKHKYKPVHIPEHAGLNDQYSKLGKHHWSVSRLVQLSKDFEISEIPLIGLNIFNTYERLTLREMVSHIKAVQSADLNYPIILDEDGEIMDGRHRVMKAILDGKETIKAVRFDVNPDPCKVDGD